MVEKTTCCSISLEMHCVNSSGSFEAGHEFTIQIDPCTAQLQRFSRDRKIMGFSFVVARYSGYGRTFFRQCMEQMMGAVLEELKRLTELIATIKQHLTHSTTSLTA